MLQDDYGGARRLARRRAVRRPRRKTSRLSWMPRSRRHVSPTPAPPTTPSRLSPSTVCPPSHSVIRIQSVRGRAMRRPRRRRRPTAIMRMASQPRLRGSVPPTRAPPLSFTLFTPPSLCPPCPALPLHPPHAPTLNSPNYLSPPLPPLPLPSVLHICASTACHGCSQPKTPLDFYIKDKLINKERPDRLGPICSNPDQFLPGSDLIKQQYKKEFDTELNAAGKNHYEDEALRSLKQYQKVSKLHPFHIILDAPIAPCSAPSPRSASLFVPHSTQPSALAASACPVYRRPVPLRGRSSG